MFKVQAAPRETGRFATLRRERRERVHNQVNPQHLHSRDRALLVSERADDRAHDRRDVHRELELEELAVGALLGGLLKIGVETKQPHKKVVASCRDARVRVRQEAPRDHGNAAACGRRACYHATRRDDQAALNACRGRGRSRTESQIDTWPCQ